ncbi:MAG: hypothetical protein HUJ26_20065 [Planctomycetaceae bacterium]|nr:hypothetical protein [Planctomycetaceae bacterium]
MDTPETPAKSISDPTRSLVKSYLKAVAISAITWLLLSPFAYYLLGFHLNECERHLWRMGIKAPPECVCLRHQSRASENFGSDSDNYSELAIHHEDKSERLKKWMRELKSKHEAKFIKASDVEAIGKDFPSRGKLDKYHESPNAYFWKVEFPYSHNYSSQGGVIVVQPVQGEIIVYSWNY